MKTAMKLAILAIILLTATAVSHSRSQRMMMKKGGMKKAKKAA